MQFGKTEAHNLDTIAFSLPPDPGVNVKVLGRGKGHTKFYIGCAKWGRKDWVGILYPPHAKEKDFLHYYSGLFNAIEFNGFYYNQHTAQQVHKWRDAVTSGFLFCPKFTQVITHDKNLQHIEAELGQFIKVLQEFGNNLGPVFLMPNPAMDAGYLPVIENFIKQVPSDIDLFLELRHPSWYGTPGSYNKEVFKMLFQQQRGTVITDAAGRRDCVHMHLSIPQCFIRFVGNSLHRTDYERIDDWVLRLKTWMEQGLAKCYFFMHQHDELHSPQLIKYFIERLNAVCGTEIPVPHLHI